MLAKIKIPSSVFVKPGYRFIFYLVANVTMDAELAIYFQLLLNSIFTMILPTHPSSLLHQHWQRQIRT